MNDRKGEKLGWTGGLTGGFIWVAVLGSVFFYQGKHLYGIVSFGLVAAAVFFIFRFTPWRYPNTPYWKLLLGPYAVFIVSVVWVVIGYGGMEILGLYWWNFLWLLGVLTPVFVLGKRKWSEHGGSAGE